MFQEHYQFKSASLHTTFVYIFKIYGLQLLPFAIASDSKDIFVFVSSISASAKYNSGVLLFMKIVQYTERYISSERVKFYSVGQGLLFLQYPVVALKLSVTLSQWEGECVGAFGIFFPQASICSHSLLVASQTFLMIFYRVLITCCETICCRDMPTNILRHD